MVWSWLFHRNGVVRLLFLESPGLSNATIHIRFDSYIDYLVVRPLELPRFGYMQERWRKSFFFIFQNCVAPHFRSL
jgi:hypothetical protein